MPVRPSSPSPFPISAAEDQQTSDVEGEVGKAIVEKSAAILTAIDTMVIDLLSNLCQKIDVLGAEIGKRNDGLDDNQQEQKTN